MKKKIIYTVVLFFSGALVKAQTLKSYTFDPELLLEGRNRVLQNDPWLLDAKNAIVNGADALLASSSVNITQKTSTDWMAYFDPNVTVLPTEFVNFSGYFYPPGCTVTQVTDKVTGKIKDTVVCPTGINYTSIVYDNSGKPEAWQGISKPLENKPMLAKFTDGDRLSNMVNRVTKFTYAFWVTNNSRYADSAISQLRAWFINPTTAMKPHLKFGQIVPFDPIWGTGTRWGVLMLQNIPDILNCVEMLIYSNKLSTNDLAVLKTWMSQYANWLNTDGKGISERNADNNHGFYLDLQILSCWAFADEYSKIGPYIDAFTKYRMIGGTNFFNVKFPGAIGGVTDTVVDAYNNKQNVSGGAVLELPRDPKAAMYSTYNHSALVSLAVLANNFANQNLWDYNYNAADKKSLREALEWFIPYFKNPTSWTFDREAFAIYRIASHFWISSQYSSNLENGINHETVFNDMVMNAKGGSDYTNSFYIFWPKPYYFRESFTLNNDVSPSRRVIKGGSWTVKDSTLKLLAPLGTSGYLKNLLLFNKEIPIGDYSYSVKAKLISKTINDGFSIVFNANSDNYNTTYLTVNFAVNNPNATGIFEVTSNNTAQKIASFSSNLNIVPNHDYTVRIERKGNAFSVYLNNVMIASLTKTSIRGRVGVGSIQSEAIFDDIAIEKANEVPTVALSLPVTNTKLPSPATLQLTANTSDPDGSIAKVEFYEGNNLIGTKNTSPYSFSWGNVASGNYSITAKAYDNQGAIATSTPVSITVVDLTWKNISFGKNISNESKITYTVTTSSNVMNLVTGIGTNLATDYDSLACIVRFSDAGTIDVRDGNTYRADAIIPYQANTIYSVEIITNPQTHLYTVNVTPKGSNKTLLATSYKYRTAQQDATKLSFLSGFEITVKDYTLGNLQITTGFVTELEKDSETNENNSLCFPNPTKGLVYFQKEASFVLSNAYGEEIIKGTDNKLDMSTLPSGMYYLNIQQKTSKIVKE